MKDTLTYQRVVYGTTQYPHSSNEYMAP